VTMPPDAGPGRAAPGIAAARAWGCAPESLGMPLLPDPLAATIAMDPGHHRQWQPRPRDEPAAPERHEGGACRKHHGRE
jgi:hypothetical protein